MHSFRVWTCGRTAENVEPLWQISDFAWHSTNKSGQMHICVLWRYKLACTYVLLWRMLTRRWGNAGWILRHCWLISVFWLQKDCFQFVINTPKLWNRGTNLRRRKLKIAHGLLLSMKPCWSFLESVDHKAGWYPIENGHAQIAFRAKPLRTPDPYYDRKKFHLTNSIVKRREDEFGGYLRWTMTWTKNSFPQVWKKKLKFLLQSSYLQIVHTLPRYYWHLRLLANSWNTSWTLWMAVMPREENRVACVVFMLMTCFLVELQSFWSSSRRLSSHNSRVSWRCERLDVHRPTCQMDHWWEDQEEISHHCWTVFVSVNLLRLSYLKVGRMKTHVIRISTLSTGHS